MKLITTTISQDIPEEESRKDYPLLLCSHLRKEKSCLIPCASFREGKGSKNHRPRNRSRADWRGVNHIKKHRGEKSGASIRRVWREDGFPVRLDSGR